MAGSRVTVTCSDCGSTQSIPELPRRGVARCRRCDRVLAREQSAHGLELALACSAAVLLLLPPAAFMPLMHSTIMNLVFDQSRLVSSVGAIYREVWFPFAFGFLFFAFGFPAIRSLLLTLVLGAIRFGFRLPQHGRLFRWSEELRMWSMTDVVVIAGAVAYLRAGIPADVEILGGAWIYLAVAFCVFLGERALDRRSVWNAILPDHDVPATAIHVSCDVCQMVVLDRRKGDPCPRCGARLDPSVARRFAPAFAAVAAAIPLTLPAYSFAVMVNDQLTAVLEHTILGTVQLMADRGYWQYGVVILLCGVVIPFAELIGLVWLLGRVRFPQRRGLVFRTQAYRVLHRLVRWPMIIPFIAAVAAPIVDFRGIDDIVAGPGATPLFMLITLLMLAMRLFEPRLMWKTAGEAR